MESLKWTHNERFDRIKKNSRLLGSAYCDWYTLVAYQMYSRNRIEANTL